MGRNGLQEAACPSSPTPVTIRGGSFAPCNMALVSKHLEPKAMVSPMTPRHSWARWPRLRVGQSRFLQGDTRSPRSLRSTAVISCCEVQDPINPFFFPKTLQEISPKWGTTTEGRRTSDYSWSGGMVWIKGSLARKPWLPLLVKAGGGSAF